ncbi:MAG: EamA family transporter [Pseudomonadales bacterium]|jgi:drug/metabolite transporter (DMT)-like permease|nr:EamA family transporter [Pseudomonadales bacterium]
MSLTIMAAVLLAALLHAGWNALVKVNADPLVALALMATGAGVVGLCGLPFVPLPGGAALPWLAAALVLHTFYKLFLLQAYATGDFGHVYPLARGTAPLLVTLVSVVWVGEPLAGTTLVAVLFLTAGVISLAFRGGAMPVRKDPRPLLYALATAAFIASYSVVDALGARASTSPHAYALWLFALDALPMIAIALALRRGRVVAAIAAHWRPGLAGGAMSVLAYWLVIWSMTEAPMAPVSALRETSVLFAALLSVLVLRERFGALRLVATLCVVTGVALLGR